MTAKQVKEVEEIALDIVKKGLPVHAKECSLSLAKEIQGLRAVFDEVCLCTHVCVCVCVCVCVLDVMSFSANLVLVCTV